MNKLTNMKISEQRARTIIDSYGASADAWPEDERRAVLALLEESASLRACREEAARLDQALGIPPAVGSSDTSALAGRILENLPPQQPGRAASHGYWTGLAAAASLAAVVFSIVYLMPATSPPQERINVADVNEVPPVFEQWAWEEVLDQTPTASLNNGNDPLSLLLPEFENNLSDTI
jgi:hypothetical protein